MLSVADNELMARVGPGTPMGNFLRQYWIPSTVPSRLLPTADCPPIRVRLLGEDLIAFRTTSGSVGLVANACPHRGASMFFGRNEEEGLRCVYHGWKFDVAGTCVDMPSEPPESNFKSKVRIKSYPCREVNGMVWAYMGDREELPGLPELEYNNAPEENCFSPTLVFYDCNWVQAMEGDLDSVHIDYLHSRLSAEPLTKEQEELWEGVFANRDRAPRLLARPMSYGAIYGAERRWDDQGNKWHRISQFILPFYTMTPGGGGSIINFTAYVPIDDEHTLHVAMKFSTAAALASERRTPRDPYKILGGYLPATSDPLTRWRAPSHQQNDYLIDRDIQRTLTFCGIPNPQGEENRGGKLQDKAVVETMGGIYDRTKEHLGSTDSMIITVRRVLINAAKDLRDKGIVHPTANDPSMYKVRSVQIILPDGVDWLEATTEHRNSDAGVRFNFEQAQLVR